MKLTSVSGVGDQVVVHQHDEEALGGARAQPGVRVKQVLLADDAARAHPPAGQDRRIVGDQVRRQPVKVGRDNLCQERAAATGHVRGPRVDAFAQRVEQRRTVGTHEAPPAPVVVARENDRRNVGT